MNPDQFRRLALDLPDTEEGAHMGHPDFRAANGRIFASLHSGDRTGMVALTPEEQAAFLESNPETFEPSSGAWGRSGYTSVLLATADRRTVRGAMQLAWERIATKPRARKPATRRPRTQPARAGKRKAR